MCAVESSRITVRSPPDKMPITFGDETASNDHSQSPDTGCCAVTTAEDCMLSSIPDILLLCESLFAQENA